MPLVCVYVCIMSLSAVWRPSKPKNRRTDKKKNWEALNYLFKGNRYFPHTHKTARRSSIVDDDEDDDVDSGISLMHSDFTPSAGQQNQNTSMTMPIAMIDGIVVFCMHLPRSLYNKQAVFRRIINSNRITVVGVIMQSNAAATDTLTRLPNNQR